MISPAAGGIAALGPQAQPQMPGQADPQAIQNILQQGQGAGTPAQGTGITPNLKSLKNEELIAASQSKIPGIIPIAALGELSNRIKAANKAKMAQGQEAMQQASQMQNQPPIAQQVLAAASKLNSGIGTQPYNYATGGVVAFSNGGNPLDRQAEEDRKKLGEILQAVKDKGLLPASAAIADLATLVPRGVLGALNSTVIRGLRAAGAPIPYIPDFLSPGDNDFSSRTPFYDKYVRSQEAPPIPDYANDLYGPTPPAPPKTPVDRLLNQGKPQARPPQAARLAPTPAPTPTQAMPIATSNLPKIPTTDEKPINAAYENMMSAQRSRAEPSAAELEARAGINRLREEDLAARRANEEANRKFAEESYNMAKERGQKLSPADYFKIAGGMDTRKGYGLKTLSQGMGSVLEQRQAAQDAARKEYGAAMEKNRALQDVNRNLGIAEAERKAAIQTQDRGRLEAAEDKINEYTLQREALLRGLKGTEFAQGIQLAGAEAQRENAVSSRISAEAARKQAETQAERNRILESQKLAVASGSKQIPPDKLAKIKADVVKNTDAMLKSGSPLALQYLRLRKDPEAQARFRDQLIEHNIRIALQNEFPGSIPNIAGFSPSTTPAAPGNRIKFNDIP